ncbi:Carbohydrate esterase, partial [Globisporangium splendens]
MLSSKVLAAEKRKKLSLLNAVFVRVLALLRQFFVIQGRRVDSAAAAANRRLVVAGVTGATGSALLLTYIARSFCQTPYEIVHLTLHVGYTVMKTVVAYIARGFRPLYPNWTFRFEVLRAVMRCTTELYGHRAIVETHAKHIRHTSSVLGSAVGWCYSKFHGSRVEPVHANGLEHVWIKDNALVTTTTTGSAGSKDDTHFVVIYYHGGGYAVLSPRMYIYFCNTFRSAIRDELKRKYGDNTRVDFLLANYRKIPEHPFPIPAMDAVAMYDYVVEQLQIPSRRVIIAGDSAGAGLVMSTLLRVRDRDPRALPLAGILICPCADLSESEKLEPSPHCVLSQSMIDASRQAYHLTSHDRATWLDASPAHCDLRNLPPVFLQTATLDSLHAHSKELIKKVQLDGVTNWEIDIQHDVPHVFTVFPTIVLPYAMVGIQNMAAFAAKHFHQPTLPEHQDNCDAVAKKMAEEECKGISHNSASAAA